MSSLAVKSHVEVCIWIAKDPSGNFTNAYTGATTQTQGGRVGHASLKIYPTPADQTTYAPLMISGKDHIYVSLWPGRFEKTHEDDIDLENKELPNAIISLRKLNVSKMLAELDKVVTANWVLKSKANTSLLQSAQSCAGFVYALLDIGEIYTKYTQARYAGPRNWTFYSQTNCHLGDILGGFFNSFPWRAWAVSPKLVLHVTASAAESDAQDKQDTLTLMSSSQVQQGTPGSNAKAIAGGATIAGLGTAAAVGLSVAKAHKLI